MSSSKCPPKVIWAQTATKVLVSVCLEDCKDPTIKVEEKKLFFSGAGGKDKSEYEVTMELFDEVVPEETTKHFLDRVIEITLTKKDANKAFWTRLIQDKKRQHWLSIDFLKWKDESDDESDGDIGGMGGMAGMPGMGGMAGMPGMGGMGGMPGMGGMGGLDDSVTPESLKNLMKMRPDLNDLDDDDDEGDDEGDIPGLMD